MTKARPGKPATLDAWREMYLADDWDAHRLQHNPPRWIAVQFQDGTIDFAYVSGLRTQFPSLMVECHGSHLRAEVAVMTLVYALREGNAIKI
jgi:hypothetical protein